jgi:hypothetical protein
MKFFNSIAAIAFGLAALAGATRAAQAADNDMSLRIANNMPVRIVAFEVTPAGGTQWLYGARIDADIDQNLPFGAVLRAEPGQCRFDVRFRFEDGATRTVTGVDLCRDPTLTVSPDAIGLHDSEGQRPYFQISA